VVPATATTLAHLAFHLQRSPSGTKHLNYKVSSNVGTMCERSKRDHLCLCPLEGVIDTMGKKWTLLVVNAIGNRGRLRFSQMMEELRGISPTTLSDTLQELQREGLIGRESFPEIPPRVEYSLTKDGAQLRKAILPLLQWASTRSGPGKRSAQLRTDRLPSFRSRGLLSRSSTLVPAPRSRWSWLS
jgi:DNA-binding HxlR family transcriptional regulator